MAESVLEPGPDSNVESMSELISEAKANSTPHSTSDLMDDSEQGPISEYYSSMKYYRVRPHTSSSPLPDNGIVCATCTQLSYEQLCTPQGQSYHESWTSLVENAAQGCRLCTFFTTVKAPVPEMWGQADALSLRINEDLLYLFGSEDDRCWTFQLCLPADIDEPLPELAKSVRDTLRYPDRACEKSIHKIQKWINECETTHPLCRKPEASFLPSRVLDISHEGSSQSISPVESKDIKADYVTLSYCWGREAENANGQISICTSQNIKQLFRGVSIDVLPPLFKDAVIMTQKLGKRYIWIDALCIIQDSKDDWAKECPRMADIYANSFLTISAASCQNKQDRFIEATMFEQQAKLAILPGTQGQYIHVRPFFCSTPPTPLMDRAWAFQERLLSARILHLTSLEMVLQCDNHQFSSCREACAAHGCGKKSFLWNTAWMPFGGLDGKHTENIWHGVVQRYAHLGLSYKTDRLPALSSIAHLIQQRFLVQDGVQANYVAGLWEHDLAYGLLWSVYGYGEIEAKVSSPYVGPTWSWVSIRKQELRRRHSVRRDLLKLRVVDVQAHPSTSNPFGEISSAYLTVDAPLRRVFTRDMQTNIGIVYARVTHTTVQGFAKVHFSFDNGNWEVSTSEAFWLLPCMTDAVLEDSELCWKSESQIRMMDRWDGLALELVDEKQQVYERVGVFAIYEPFSEKRTWHDLDFVDTRVTII